MAENKVKLNPVSSVGPGSVYLRPELKDMKVIGVEEHVSFPNLLQRIPDQGVAQHARKINSEMVKHEALAYAQGRLFNVAAERLRDMDEGQIALQILSLAGAVNCTHLSPVAGTKLAKDINDQLKAAVDTCPVRFAALAELPMHAPEAAAKELRRCVTELGFVGAMMSGSIGGTGKFLDSSEFDVLLSEFEELDVPLYLHPGIAPQSVYNTYYEIPDHPQLSATLSGMGWGWHNEVAIHTIRLAVTGTLDRHPRLKVVVGHQGEMLPMMVQRFDTVFEQTVFGFQRSVGEMLRSQVWLAISGLFTLPATMTAIQTWGVGRILFANDYPFVDSQRVPEFLRALGDMVSPEDLRRICQKNAEQLFRIQA
ncbi:hypothetical protein AbraIFM66950_009644 [Aspergillus brasiliensis]|nr:hypothetical protein AbraIFM66950_009644 [Aspergillus brasiliensis]